MVELIWELKEGGESFGSIRGGLGSETARFKQTLHGEGYYFFICALPKALNQDGSLTFEKLKLQNILRRMDATRVSTFSLDIIVTVESDYQQILKKVLIVDIGGKANDYFCFEILKGFLPASITVEIVGHSFLKRLKVAAALYRHGSGAPGTVQESKEASRIGAFLLSKSMNLGIRNYDKWLMDEQNLLKKDLNDSNIFDETDEVLQVLDSPGDEIKVAPMVYDLKSSSQVGEAMFLLMDHHILSAPVWSEEDNKYLGFFDVQDGVNLSLSFRQNMNVVKDNDSSSFEVNGVIVDPDEAHSDAYGLRMPLKSFFEGGNHSLTPWRSVYPSDHMNHVLEILGQKLTLMSDTKARSMLRSAAKANPSISRSCPRVPVIDSTGKVVKVISQSEIIYQIFKRYIQSDQKKKLDSFFESDELVRSCVKVLKPVSVKDPIRLAFKRILKYDLHAVPVIDGDKKIVATITAVDVWLLSKMELEQDAVVDIDKLSVGNFLSNAERSSQEHFSKKRMKVVTVFQNTPLKEVINQIVRYRVHGVYIVDNRQRPIGRVEIVDILHAIVSKGIEIFHLNETVEYVFLYDRTKETTVMSETVRLAMNRSSLRRKGKGKDLKTPKSAATKSNNFCPQGEHGFFEIESQSTIAEHLPMSLRKYAWKRVFNIIEDGSNVLNLKDKMCHRDLPLVVAIRDSSGQVFGGFLPNGLFIEPSYRHSRHLGYMEGNGDGESFVFSFESKSRLPHVFSWTGNNRYFRIINEKGFGMGGAGEGFAFFIDDSLYEGSSNRSETYNNSCLASQERFRCSHFEVFELVNPILK